MKTNLKNMNIVRVCAVLAICFFPTFLTAHYSEKDIIVPINRSTLPEHDLINRKDPIQRYPGSVIVNYKKEDNTNKDYTIIYKIGYGVKDPYDKVADWYKNTLAKQGWKNITDDRNSDNTILTIFKKNDDIIKIYTAKPFAGKLYTSINLIYTKIVFPDHDLARGKEPLQRYPGSIMVEHHKSSLTSQTYDFTEIKVKYLTKDTFDNVKSWYLSLFRSVYGVAYDNGVSIESGARYDNDSHEIYVLVDFEDHKKYTLIHIDYVDTIYK